MSRNALLVPCTAELLASFVADGTRIITVNSPIPADAKFITAHYDPQRACFMLQFEHESFGEVAEGGMIPIASTDWMITEVEKENR